MAKRIKTKDVEVHLDTNIATLDGKRDYPVDFVREFFINSDTSLEEMALQMKLPLNVVQAHARNGLQSWYKLKQDKLEARLKYFMDVNVDNLIETHSMLEEGHLLTLIQFKGTQQFLKEYYMRNGHLFRVNEDGEISMDAYGMPIPMPIPNTPKHFMALEGFFKLKDGTKKELNHLYETVKNAEKEDVVDVEAYNVFEKE